MSEKPYLLIVEDDEGILAQLQWGFESFQVITAKNRKQAISLLRRFEPGVITLDLGLPPDPDGVDEGLLTLDEIVSLKPLTKVIVVTGQSDREHALKAVSQGAYDFFVKPFDLDVVNLAALRAQHVYELERENQNLFNNQLSQKVPGLFTSAPSMEKVCSTIAKIAKTPISALLLGESGTGKEVLARGLHALSKREGPFVAINCAAIPENLLESELFGYEKGAFTGAHQRTIGKVEQSSKGTLFLDEIGDLPLSLQPKLLRFLQEKTIERIGGRTSIEVDSRIVCATHQSIQTLIEQGKFREDLYYRISEMSIEIPPLRERGQDPLLLSKVFMRHFSKEFTSKVTSFSDKAKDAILEYSWPGNIRELENRVKRACVMAEGSVIDLDDLDLPFIENEKYPFNLKQVKDEATKSAIERALYYVDGNMTKASQLLGITRPTLYHLLDTLGLGEKEYK